MNVISRKKLKAFYESKPAFARHAKAFNDWFRLVRKAAWQNFQDGRSTFGQTDVAKGKSGKTATIFDIGGNKYRVVTLIDYRRQTVLIKRVMTHEEYDTDDWKQEF